MNEFCVFEMDIENLVFNEMLSVQFSFEFNVEIFRKKQLRVRDAQRSKIMKIDFTFGNPTKIIFIRDPFLIALTFRQLNYQQILKFH